MIDDEMDSAFVGSEGQHRKEIVPLSVRKLILYDEIVHFQTNEKGQVTVKSSVLKQMEDIKEETGLVCCICREGYRYQPSKVLPMFFFQYCEHSYFCNIIHWVYFIEVVLLEEWWSPRHVTQ